MAEPAPVQAGGHAGRGRTEVVVTSAAATSAYGRGAGALIDGVLTGQPAFAEVTRFDVSDRRVRVAAQLPGAPVLRDELIDVIDQACAGLTPPQRASCPLLLAVNADPAAARVPVTERAAHQPGAFAAALAHKCGLGAGGRTYTTACVAASTAVADGAAMIARGDADRVLVAAGYLVDPDQFALFDAGRALATDGAVRPFSRGRTGLLLGDGVAAVLLEAARQAAARRVQPLARLAGWGRAGDAYHVCQPRPDGAGMARAIAAALRRAGIGVADVGYVNAHGSGSRFSDAAEANALLRALGAHGARVPISSSKSLHGQALEASPLLELIVTILAAGRATLPITAGYLGPDPDCPLDVIVDRPRAGRPAFALSLNSAFGGANTALLVGAA